MQTVTELIFRLSPPGGVFDETVIRNILADRSSHQLLIIDQILFGDVEGGMRSTISTVFFSLKSR